MKLKLMLKMGLTLTAALISLESTSFAEAPLVAIRDGREVNIAQNLVNEHTVIRPTSMYVYIGETDELHLQGQNLRAGERRYVTLNGDDPLRRQVYELRPQGQADLDVKLKKGALIRGEDMARFQRLAPGGSLNGYFVRLDRFAGTDRNILEEDSRMVLKQVNGLKKGAFLHDVAQNLPAQASNLELRTAVAENMAKIPKGVTMKEMIGALPPRASLAKALKGVSGGLTKAVFLSSLVAAGAQAQAVEAPAADSKTAAGVNTRSMGSNDWARSAAPVAAEGAK